MNEDVELAFESLRNKQYPYAQLWRYYNGDHPLQYATRRLEQVFAKLDAKWTENWCAVVVDSLMDRIHLSGFSIEDNVAQETLKDIWSAENADLDAERVHKAVAVCGEGFVIVSEIENDDAETGKITRIYANRPHLVHAVYSEEDPKRMEFASKWWEADGKTYLTMYYPDHFEYYEAAGRRSDIGTWNNFHPVSDDEGGVPEAINTYGRIPVFHFCPDPERVLGELTNVVPLNNAINKLFADMMVAAEFSAFKQRFIVSNADNARLVSAPNEVWEISAAEKGEEPTQIGQFEATDLKNFIDAMDNLATKIAVITRTPKHYLLQVGDVSGEALLAMEAPLVKKSARYNERFATTWRDLAAFVLTLAGSPVDKSEIEVLWDDEHTVQPKTEAEIRKINVEAGMPLITQLRLEGWTEDQIKLMEKDQDKQKEQQATLGQAVTEEVMRKFDQGQVGAPYTATPPAPEGTGAPLPTVSSAS